MSHRQDGALPATAIFVQASGSRCPRWGSSPSRSVNPMRLETQFLPTFFGVIAFACAVNAKDDLSLTRVTPVPADQQVPLVDFIRPLLFGRPQLNPSGTRFAAFIENQHFSQNVLDCDIATGK